jgi:hypothetical protein
MLFKDLMLFVDLEKAFDIVQREALFQRLHDTDVSKTLLTVIVRL